MFHLFKSQREKTRDKIARQTVALLREQIDDARRKSISWAESFGTNFAIGYILGFSTILIKSKTKNDEDTSTGLLKVFESLFGKDNGIRFMLTVKNNMSNPDFEKGFLAARDDLVGFIDERGRRPSSLLQYLCNM